MAKVQKFSNSTLATLKYPAHKDNYTDGRSKKIDTITPHHMAGKLSARACGSIFQNKNRHASSNYGIGYDGEIALYVDEENTSWCNSNWDSNCRSVTIEVSNSSTGGNWPISDKSLNSLILLMADIAKRNNMGTLIKGKNVTWHSMYKNTTCPGKYLLSKLDYIIEEVNKINNNNSKNISKVSYYKKYIGNSNSIVDALKSIGVNSSFKNRKKIAIKNGISNYKGKPYQNIKMLNLLKVGKLIKI